ncbi:MAG: exopolyphosphatase, partial [Pseudomonadales bacterium]|nr:exopolyphosphatase [Pseudomonadales bacterium]
AFDHHASEIVRLGGEKPDNHIIDTQAPSAARVVYDYYGGQDAFSTISTAMMEAVDKADSAQFNKDEILNPTDWVLLNYLMDSRTGLGRFRDFTVSNYQLMMHLIDYCNNHTIAEILQLPDVKERVDLYQDHKDKFVDQIKRCATVHNNLVVLDLRHEETIYAGNRFMIYALYPECNISIHVLWGLKKQNTVFAIGKSILNRTSNTNIGELCLHYGGGGHQNAGTCQRPNDSADADLKTVVESINADG